MKLTLKENLFLEKYADLNKTYIAHPPYFRFRDKRKYTADFYCKEDNTYIEVVGTRQAYHANKDKYALMAIEFPLIKFEIFFFPKEKKERKARPKTYNKKRVKRIMEENKNTMKRVNYHLTEQQIKSLKKYAKKTDIAVAELIRRLVDEFFKTKEK